MPSFRHVSIVITPGTLRADIDTLGATLQVYSATAKTDTDSSQIQINNVSSTNAIKCGAEKGMELIKPRAALFKQLVTVKTWKAVGRLCTEPLCPYPPVITVLISGEM